MVNQGRATLARFLLGRWSPEQKFGPETQKFGEPTMREWHKPTIEETESGMEVTSYLPAELDRA